MIQELPSQALDQDHAAALVLAAALMVLVNTLASVPVPAAAESACEHESALASALALENAAALTALGSEIVLAVQQAAEEWLALHTA